MRAVVALGGNALGGGEVDREERRRRIHRTSRQLADLVAAGHEVVVVHGNGPQVGELLLDQESRHEPHRGEPLPLDVLVAMTQAELGYLLQRSLGTELAVRGLGGGVVTVLTQVVVAADDPAFARPTKPVGPRYLLRPGDGRDYVLTGEDRWRRVVPSPAPVRVVERDALTAILGSGIVPICGGGGGIPVTEVDGRLVGVEAVVDKDATSALLARDLDAGALLILTDVERVQRAYGTPDAHEVEQLTTTEASAMIASGEAPAGSMAPKLAAAIAAVDDGREVVIAKLGSALEALAGRTGTRIVPGSADAAERA